MSTDVRPHLGRTSADLLSRKLRLADRGQHLFSHQHNVVFAADRGIFDAPLKRRVVDEPGGEITLGVRLARNPVERIVDDGIVGKDR